MSTVIQNRQPAGRPTGGEYAPTVHGEPDITLAAPPRPEGLSGWPDTLPVPTFDVAWEADGAMTTQVNAGGAVLNAYTKDYDGAVATAFEGRGHEGWTEVEQEQARAWAADVHTKFEARIREEAQRAAEMARHRVAAEIIGASSPISTASMTSVHKGALERGWMAHRDAELSATSLLARQVRNRHSDASYAELETDYDDNGERYISSITSYTADGDFLERLRNDGVAEDEDGHALEDDDDGDEDVREMMSCLTVENVVSYLFHPRPKGDDHGYYVDLRRAVDWAPGAEDIR